MSPVYEYRDYKTFFNELVLAQENKGRGYYRKIAEALGVSPVSVSQVLKGERDFDKGKIYILCRFFNLNKLETDYILCLFEMNTVNSFELEKYLEVELNKLSFEMKRLCNQLTSGSAVDDRCRRIYYSSWLYSAVRLSLLCDEVSSLREVCDYLGFSESKIKPIVDFLEESGLIAQAPMGRYYACEKIVHLPEDSHFITNHHMNIKNLELQKIVQGIESEEICYSSLVVTSKKVIQEQIKKFRKAIVDANTSFSEGEAEELVLFNLSLLSLTASNAPSIQSESKDNHVSAESKLMNA